MIACLVSSSMVSLDEEGSTFVFDTHAFGEERCGDFVLDVAFDFRGVTCHYSRVRHFGKGCCFEAVPFGELVFADDVCNVLCVFEDCVGCCVVTFVCYSLLDEIDFDGCHDWEFYWLFVSGCKVSYILRDILIYRAEYIFC